MLRRINVTVETFNTIVTRYAKNVEHCSITDYLTEGYEDKKVIKVDLEKNSLIIQGYRLNAICRTRTLIQWMQYVCVSDDSLDHNSDIRSVPFARQANRKINKLLLKHYTKDKIEDLLKTHSLFSRQKPVHLLLPMSFHDDRVHKFTNCVYYDINGAHTDALCEIFPLARKDLIKLHDEEGGKDYINIYVGDLCNNKHRGTFDWIVQRTRNKLEDIIKRCEGGLLLYANTDGVIIWKPKHKLESSKEVGGFKSECNDGIIYAYCCKKDDQTTAYTVYQYNHPTKGIQIKGNARLAIRKQLNLTKGIIVKSKLIRLNGVEKHTNLRTLQVGVRYEN